MKTAVSLLFLLSLLSCTETDRKIILELDREYVPSIITDGGSIPLTFIRIDGEKIELILDQSVVDPSEGKPHERGHLYLGFKNFEKKKKLEYNSIVSSELLACLEEEKENKESTYPKDILDKFIKKNQAQWLCHLQSN